MGASFPHSRLYDTTTYELSMIYEPKGDSHAPGQKRASTRCLLRLSTLTQLFDFSLLGDGLLRIFLMGLENFGFAGEERDLCS